MWHFRLIGVLCAVGVMTTSAAAVDNGAFGLPSDKVVDITDAGAFTHLKPVAMVEDGDVRLTVDRFGAIQVEIGGDAYVIDSCFTYPGQRDGNPMIGWNALPEPFTQDNYPDVSKQLGPEASWRPRVLRKGNTIHIAATGRAYRLMRTVSLVGRRIDIRDTFTNRRNQPTGVTPRYRITAQDDYLASYTPGLEVAANPSVFLVRPNSRMGVVMVDSISRRRIRPWTPGKGNRAGFQVNRVAMDTGATQIFEWSAYALDATQGYFDFINAVRADWQANFTLQGPFAYAFLDDTNGNFRFETSTIPWNLAEIEADPSKLREYLKWKQAKIIAPMPWLDYDPGALDHVVTRDEYLAMFRPFIRVMKIVDPEIRIIGCIETDWVTQRTGIDKLPVPTESGITSDALTDEHIAAIEAALPQWRDSFIRSATGKLQLEQYYRGGAWVEPAVRVFPMVGNHHFDFLMGQVNFLIDEVGTDGAYFDEFALGQIGSQRTYLGTWDGISAEMNFDTGEIFGQYIDCSLAAIEARVQLINHLRSRGKVVVANRHSTSREEQSLVANRFTETGWSLTTMDWQPGEKPPAINYLFFSHLNSPLGLAIANGLGEKPSAERLMKGLIAYLRHGMVYYHHALHEPPRDQGFGPMNHMYPLTPVELGEGYIIGNERILTAISMQRTWPDEPTIRVFGMNGLEVDASDRCTAAYNGDRWDVSLKLRDWAEIAVVE